jgi:hypothetical protein
MWWMTTQKNGVSALGLQRVLGLKQYQIAWTWLHKLRSAMVRPGRDLLAGRVEVDECFLGSEEEGLRGRLVESKALIVVAAEEDGRRIGRIRLRLIPDASAESLHRFILDSIALGNVVHTDGWRGYSGLKTKGYIHQITVLKGICSPSPSTRSANMGLSADPVSSASDFASWGCADWGKAVRFLAPAAGPLPHCQTRPNAPRLESTPGVLAVESRPSCPPSHFSILAWKRFAFSLAKRRKLRSPSSLSGAERGLSRRG